MELALFCVVAPDLASIVKPVPFGHVLPHGCSSDVQEWNMEIRINKTTRSLGARALQSWCLETHVPQCSWRTDAKAWCFPGRRGLDTFLLRFRYRCFVLSLPQNWQKRSQRKTFRRNQGGCVLFSSKGLYHQQEGLWGWDTRIYSLVNLGVASLKGCVKILHSGLSQPSIHKVVTISL